MSAVHRTCRCATLPQDAPLPRLVRVVWELGLWLSRGVAHLVAALIRRLCEPRPASGVVVLAEVAHARRARLLEQAVRGAVARIARALDLTLAEPLVIVVAETTDECGDRSAVLEREVRADGTIRFLLRLALAPQGHAQQTSVDALLAAVGSQLLVLQRHVEGTSAVVIGAPSTCEPVPLRPVAHPEHVVAFPGRNGHHGGPFDPPRPA